MSKQSLERAILLGDVVRDFGSVRLRVFGTSMVPSILPGDVISVRRADISEITSGQIVLYSRAGRLFAHRVVAGIGSPEEPLLVTHGDRLTHDDFPISSNELLGLVTSGQNGETCVLSAILDIRCTC
jgi:hypothetical protein